jgi:hypothetical protein
VSTGRRRWQGCAQPTVRRFDHRLTTF